MVRILLLLSGGALGTLARYFISVFSNKLTSSTFPTGTFLVNIIGSFLIGCCWAFFNQKPTDNVKAFLFIGLFGGFTTFSSFALETLNLMRNGDYKIAISYVLLSNVIGLALVFAGFFLVKGRI